MITLNTIGKNNFIRTDDRFTSAAAGRIPH
ncbi:hypothetical protein IMSAGC013_03632 [Lachnospiraceae bacterium]|nr:hypothetical protein IMSAGC013_03632 [Lachnospiraceae bacterium]